MHFNVVFLFYSFLIITVVYLKPSIFKGDAQFFKLGYDYQKKNLIIIIVAIIIIIIIMIIIIK